MLGKKQYLLLGGFPQSIRSVRYHPEMKRTCLRLLLPALLMIQLIPYYSQIVYSTVMVFDYFEKLKLSYTQGERG